MTVRTCKSCGEILPAGSRSTREFCNNTCRWDWHNLKTKRKRVPADVRFDVFHRDEFTCVYCGMTPLEDAAELQVDHLVALEDGGAPLDLNNLVTSCVECNQGKGSRTVFPSEVPGLQEILDGD